MKKKKKTTVTALRKAHAEVVRKLRDRLAIERFNVAHLRDQMRQIRDRDIVDLNAYDKCADAVTANERALFEASPAYRRYQEWRRTGQFVRKGDWRAP